MTKVEVMKLLPSEFADLEPLAAEWALPTEAKRAAKRHASDIAYIQTFYDSLLPRLDDVLSYLAKVPLDNLSDSQKRLLDLSLAFCEIATAVELYRQPAVVDGFEPSRFPRIDVANMALPEI